MKKIFILLLLLITVSLNANRFWEQRNQLLTVDSILSYAPSIVHYWDDENNRSYYFTDSIHWTHVFNFYPCFQAGVILQYEWGWANKTFTFSTLFRHTGFNFDIYNLDINFSFADVGFAVYKYGFWKPHEPNDIKFHLLLTPVSVGINYRIRLNKWADIMIHTGYAMQFIFPNSLIFPNSSNEYYKIIENTFISGIGFRFYTDENNI